MSIKELRQSYQDKAKQLRNEYKEELKKVKQEEIALKLVQPKVPFNETKLFRSIALGIATTVKPIAKLHDNLVNQLHDPIQYRRNKIIAKYNKVFPEVASMEAITGLPTKKQMQILKQATTLCMDISSDPTYTDWLHGVDMCSQLKRHIQRIRPPLTPEQEEVREQFKTTLTLIVNKENESA